MGRLTHRQRTALDYLRRVAVAGFSDLPRRVTSGTIAALAARGLVSVEIRATRRGKTVLAAVEQAVKGQAHEL